MFSFVIHFFRAVVQSCVIFAALAPVSLPHADSPPAAAPAAVLAAAPAIGFLAPLVGAHRAAACVGVHAAVPPLSAAVVSASAHAAEVAAIVLPAAVVPAGVPLAAVLRVAAPYADVVLAAVHEGAVQLSHTETVAVAWWQWQVDSCYLQINM